MKKTVVDNKTGQKYIYELIIPSFNCNTMFYGAAASKSDKTSIIPIYYNIFNDILEIYSKEKLPKG
jgi:S-ribosylhomocysteine lyase LuxS involved in autoinducer biosynthesis